MSQDATVRTTGSDIPASADQASSSATGGRRRRTSSVGNLNVLGNPPLSLSSTPMFLNKHSKHTRLRKLHERVTSQSDLFSKFLNSYIELSLRNTWLTPLVIVFSVYLCYFLSNNYTESNPLHMFVAISYKTDQIDSNNGYPLYDKGIKDFAFVFFYMIFFTFFREFCMYIIVKPIAIYFKITKPGKQKRFMEQFYSIIYYSLSSPCGLWVMMKLPVKWFNTYYFFENYPHKTIFSWMKVFYLGQAAFWTQQALVLVLQLEKPRKDYYELIFHHIVTMALIYSSYTFYFTWMGICIYLTMDVLDIFLSASKVLNYLDSIFTPVMFILLIGVWIYMRHYINLKILWSVLTEFKTVGSFQLDFKNQQYKCFISQPIVFVLILALQLVNIYWLLLLFRILWRFIISGEQKDERSDDEEEEEGADVAYAENKDYEFDDNADGYSTDSSNGDQASCSKDAKKKEKND